VALSARSGHGPPGPRSTARYRPNSPSSRYSCVSSTSGVGRDTTPSSRSALRPAIEAIRGARMEGHREGRHWRTGGRVIRDTPRPPRPRERADFDPHLGPSLGFSLAPKFRRRAPPPSRPSGFHIRPGLGSSYVPSSSRPGGTKKSVGTSVSAPPSAFDRPARPNREDPSSYIVRQIPDSPTV
jgi:hypothetical protein